MAEGDKAATNVAPDGVTRSIAMIIKRRIEIGL